MSRRAPLVLALIVLVTFGVPAAPQPADKDTPRATPAGTTFTLPAGWTMTTQGAMTLRSSWRTRTGHAG